MFLALLDTMLIIAIFEQGAKPHGNRLEDGFWWSMGF
jgi:hypothetical protein